MTAAPRPEYRFPTGHRVVVEMGGPGVVERVLDELTRHALSCDDPTLFGLVDVARRASVELIECGREMRIVATTAAAMAAAPDLDAGLRALLEGVSALTDAQTGSVWLPLDPDAGLGPSRVFRSHRSADPEWEDAEIVAGSIVAAVLASGRGEYATGARVARGSVARRAASAEPRAVRGMMVVALDVSGRAIGAVTAELPETRPFAPRQMAALQSLADHAAGAVEQARRRDTAEDTARLDGALKTARLVGHELNNKLALVSGYGELLVDRLGPSEHASTVQRMIEASDDAALVLRRLQHIIRFEEHSLGGTSHLDLDAATTRAS